MCGGAGTVDQSEQIRDSAPHQHIRVASDGARDKRDRKHYSFDLDTSEESQSSFIGFLRKIMEDNSVE